MGIIRILMKKRAQALFFGSLLNRVDETILVKELSSVRLLNSFLYVLFKRIEFNTIENYRYLRNNLIYNEVEESDRKMSY